jgi:uncharacterized protein (TIGR02466 family)
MTDRAADAARWRAELSANPNDRIAWHNLAAAEGDLGHAVEAEAAARRAIALGDPAAETRLVLARALQDQRRLDEAERAFDEALSLRPTYADAHRGIAQLVWMRTAKAGLALQRIDRALRAAPREASLHLIRSIVLEAAGDRDAAFAAVMGALTVVPRDTALLVQAAHLCAESGDAARALELAQQAARLAPSASNASLGVCEALVASGRLEEADALAATLCAAHPLDPYAIALQSTVWRLRGDARYAALNDYRTHVSARKLEVPRGGSSLDAFLGELAPELTALHTFRAQPLQKSARGGSVIALNPPELARPLIAALFASIAAGVREYLANLGTGSDPLRCRNTGRFAITGARSVRLGSGGYHTDHVNPEAWLSSACYIALPPSVGSGEGAPPGRAGWLRLGKPGIATSPALDPDHFVRPEPGLLVLFPAYMWHGVEPFESDHARLCVAFDVVPA